MKEHRISIKENRIAIKEKRTSVMENIIAIMQDRMFTKKNLNINTIKKLRIAFRQNATVSM